MRGVSAPRKRGGIAGKLVKTRLSRLDARRVGLAYSDFDLHNEGRVSLRKPTDGRLLAAALLILTATGLTATAWGKEGVLRELVAPVTGLMIVMELVPELPESIT